MSPSPPETGDLLDLLVYRSLRPVSAALVAVFGIFLVYNLLDLPEKALLPVAVHDSVLIALFSALYGLLTRRLLPVRWAHGLSMATAFAVASNVLLTMGLLAEPFYTVYVMVVLIGVGGLMLSRTWVLVTLGGIGVGWVAVGSRFLEGSELVQQSFSLLAGSALAWMLAISRQRTFLRVEELRRSDEKRARELDEEIRERRAAEERLKSLLLERDRLVRHTHHLARNNLQVVSSLMALQARDLADESARSALAASQSRVRSMALVHDQLYRSEDHRHSDLVAYAQGLVHSLRSAFSSQATLVDLRIEAEPLPPLPLDQLLPWGLLLHEIVGNSLRHAFAGRSEGTIRIRFRTMDDHLQLVVEDDGVGLPPRIDSTAGGALGFELTRRLTRQLGGRLAIQGGHGTRVKITVPLARPTEEADSPREGVARLRESLESFPT